MLWASVFVLMVPWRLGWIDGYTMGGWFIHALLSSIVQGRRSRDPLETINKPTEKGETE